MSAVSKLTNGLQIKPVSSAQARPRQRLWLALSLLVTVVTVVSLVAYLLLALSWRGHPFFGAIVSHTLVVGTGKPTSDASWPGLDAGLQPMDKLTTIKVYDQNRQTLVNQQLAENPTDYITARQSFSNVMTQLKAGQIVEVEFQRPAPNNVVVTSGKVVCTTPIVDNMATCRVRFTPGSFPLSDFVAFFVIPFACSVIVLLIGLLLLWLRYQQPVALLASGICMTLAIFMGGIFDLSSTFALIPLWLVAGIALGGMLATLALVFPLPMPLVYRRPYVRYIPTAAAVIVGMAALIAYAPRVPQDYLISIKAAGLAAFLGLALLFFALLFQRRRAFSILVRDQSNTILIGIVLVALPAALWVVVWAIQTFINPSVVLPISVESTMPFFMIPAVSIAYAVLQFRRIDTDRVISQGIAYSIMLGALIVGYFLLVLGVTLIARDTINVNNPFLITLTIFVIALLFLPVRTHLQRRIDEIYFRVRRNYQQKTEEFAHQLTTLNAYAPIVKSFKTLLDETIAPTHVFLFLPDRQTGDFLPFGDPRPETDVRFGADSGVVATLKQGSQAVYLEPGQPWPDELRIDRARLTILRALFIAGLWGSSSQLNGFVIIGPPRSGANRYNFEELRFLINAISQLNAAVERASVIDSLERSVRELDVLSQVAQAVNFTIKFDDLLELISAQTARLVEAPCFYIAMHDYAADQLYYVFFLEGDERVAEKEGQRWNVGRDLFSEIIRAQKPIRVDDYVRAMADRRITIVHESRNLKAWMGVPLIAGARVLGVMAVGKTATNTPYTEDQLKVFDKIGALAATSIEKARLFDETNLRARQLTVLNDISQKLVATESDVEKLLELIMKGAVDILAAEAGSLLLTADDDSGDLEFRVVIGGSGQQLIGSRVKAGKGLVGEVAKTGKSIITNDASHDPRHAEGVSEFRTTSILAVPLIAKDRVIGVLEVLNKKDGTIYIDEDIALLTTFAGQAAIAIENARLFQMTDLQLSKRVQELEALERIDFELSRTLDIQKVAEVTVKWAIANIGAQAGALGVVTSAPPCLLIVASYGYKTDDYPEGADGNRWPLDRGIVKRVMRTRQADLATDVKIDPDYLPSLQRGMSQITIPMLSGDDINAILLLETNREPRFTLSDWGFAVRLAEHASIAIANAQLYAELSRANESKSEFVSFAAHELKQPLASVKGYADLLRSGVMGEIGDTQQNFLNVIRANADRMQNIIDDLRDSAKLEAKQLTIDLAPIDFRNVMIETLRPFQQQLDEKQQKIVLNVPEGLPLIKGDQNRLIQVMTNLVSNAHKYSQPESAITVTAFVDKQRVSMEHQIIPALHVAVADTGIGMSEEDLARIFHERYFRSDNPLAREQPGTGLGMMITEGIIEGHHGEIWVESKLGSGTTFHFTIPLAAQTEPQTAAQPEPASD